MIEWPTGACGTRRRVLLRNKFICFNVCDNNNKMPCSYQAGRDISFFLF